ncbi:MAG: hypothetical protein RUDDFDWM_002074 [Candidatus Fervidibacterota bacterium]
MPREVIEQLLKPDVKEPVRVEVGKVTITKGINLVVNVVDAATKTPIENAVVIVASGRVNSVVVEALARWFKRHGGHHGKAKRTTDMMLYSESDANGRATFETLPTAPLHIYAVRDGYEVAYKEITPQGGKVEITIELRRSSEGTKRKALREV